MTEIFDMITQLAGQAETWLVTTTGFGLAAIVSLLWNNRTQWRLIGQSALLDGIKKELVKNEEINGESTKKIQSQIDLVKDLVKTIKVLNDNIYILTQAANIGIENKTLIAKNYSSISEEAPTVVIKEAEKTVVIADLVQKVEETASTLNNLLEQVK
jgi:hypothetical protein